VNGMGGRAHAVVAVAFAFGALSVGCYHGSAHSVSLSDVAREPGWVVVSGMRVIRQESAHDCGAAALAMVLERWGIPDVAPEIRRTLPSPTGHGLAAGQLRGFARAEGLRAFLISGMTADLVSEIQANRPVLVGLVQQYSGNQAYAHYEVVIGFNRLDARLLLLDPGHGPREDELGSFEREWRGSAQLALVVAPS
jgi:ABC-type bacteriocin/lantibiotic exporter with double-glycine peptidase domain